MFSSPCGSVSEHIAPAPLNLSLPSLLAEEEWVLQKDHPTTQGFETAEKGITLRGLLWGLLSQGRFQKPHKHLFNDISSQCPLCGGSQFGFWGGWGYVHRSRPFPLRPFPWMNLRDSSFPQVLCTTLAPISVLLRMCARFPPHSPGEQPPAIFSGALIASILNTQSLAAPTACGGGGLPSVLPLNATGAVW